MQVEISVIIPLFNNGAAGRDAGIAVSKGLQKTRLSYEILFVNDGSANHSVQPVRELCKKKSEYRLLTLKQNYGQMIALAAGLDHSLGKCVVTFDADMQIEPRAILEFYALYKKGFDFISGLRRSRSPRPLYRKIFSWAIGFFFIVITRGRMRDIGCGANAVSTEIIDKFRRLKNRKELVKIIIFELAQNPCELPLLEDRSRHFRSGYTFFSLVRYFLKILAYYLKLPLRTKNYEIVESPFCK